MRRQVPSGRAVPCGMVLASVQAVRSVQEVRSDRVVRSVLVALYDLRAGRDSPVDLKLLVVSRKVGALKVLGQPHQ